MSERAHLRLEDVHAGYGEAEVLYGIDLTVPRGQIAAVVGANGAGKSTLLSAIAGLVRPNAGRIILDGKEIGGARANSLPARGLALVPEGGRLFPFMTVRENLELGAYIPMARARTVERLEEITEIFPILRDRHNQLAGRLSGGERQMCAIARALMSRPALLMLDEPSVGLSPIMTERVLETVARLVRDDGLTVVIVEQRVTEVLTIADEAHILDHGRIVRSGPAAVMQNDPQIQETYMGL
ncbi:amino acid/amide ABC transporter ATP-binding protein 2 (HAAT family) [Mesorhizobium sp. J18]|uniref:ABC transporter ATP-binding protein n=1 Tax=Mesorhizobium sp. J18 TaxID=935263 RepID=UPI00119BEFFE|nr:ABC transporter ATP-binding protein [Mesorhizobium sp. J18]TWG92057.1 amino acid/amide ABC transporter ATP-binding protein 2 (HAAT family) [Mesorhizobium sp. J18]